MQSIIVFFILAIFSSLISTNFIVLSELKKDKDFTFKEYISNFKLKNIDMKYAIIFFILYKVLINEITISAVIIYVPLCISLIIAFILDIKFMIIPDTSSILILLSGVVNLIVKFNKENIINSSIGILIGGFTLYIINYVFKKITKHTGFGYGDMKLLGAIGWLFGYKSVIVVMILSILISAIFSIIYLIVNKVKHINEAYLPFGPFIVLSTFIICIIPASTIISGYIQIIDTLVNKMI